MTKAIILNADDYGYHLAISQAIINLFEKNHLSATSCMTNMPAWQTTAKALHPFKHDKDIGLHFNLTEGELLSSHQSCIPLNHLIKKAYCGQLVQSEIEAELRAQLDCFFEKMQCLPNHVDGHQHIQQLPIVRDALIRVIQEYWPSKHKPYVRISSNGLLPGLLKPKDLIIHLLGAKSLKKRLIAHKIPFNSGFAGIYHLQPREDFAHQMSGFLRNITPGGIIMCHPGLSAESDSIAPARKLEYEFFISESFMTLLKKYKCKLSS